METNVLFGKEWTRMTNLLLHEFQNATVDNVRLGYTGNDVGVKIWTFSASLMFSLTVFTTIGKTFNFLGKVCSISRVRQPPLGLK